MSTTINKSSNGNRYSDEKKTSTGDKVKTQSLDYVKCSICGAKYRKGATCPNSGRADHKT